MEGPQQCQDLQQWRAYHRPHQDLSSHSVPIGQDADSLNNKLTLSNKLILTLKF